MSIGKRLPRLPGSPPRVRGHEIHGMGKRPRSRITPAGAGTWDSRIPECSETEDHPRGCGDMNTPIGVCVHTLGSPPRVRGHAELAQLLPMQRRITPAGAGTWALQKPSCIATWITPAGAGTCLRPALATYLITDHPRGCGDMAASSAAWWIALGSPPRVRGHGVHLILFRFHDRITPAGAGTCCLPSGECFRIRDHPRGCGDMSWRFIIQSEPVGSPPRVRGHVRNEW